MGPLAIYLAPKGGVPGIGPEKGQIVADGIAVYKDPYGSTRYVLYRQTVAVAALQVVSRDKKHAIIANVYTAPAYRRQGYAAKLLRKARQDFEEVRHAHESMLSFEGKAFRASVRDRASGATGPTVRRDYRPSSRWGSTKARSARRDPGEAGMTNKAWKVGLSAGNRAIDEHAFSVYSDAVSFASHRRKQRDDVLYGPLLMSEGEIAGVLGWSKARGIRGLHAKQTIPASPGSTRDPSPKKERYRMAYKHKTGFHRLGKGIIGRTTGSELHLASAEGWRESAGRMEDPKRKKEFLAHARAHEKRAASKGMQQSHRRVLEGELWKVWPKEYKSRLTPGSRRTIRMKTREGYKDSALQDLTDDEIMHLLHPARRDPAVRRDYPRVYFEKGAAWRRSTWRPGYYYVVAETPGSPGRTGVHLVDEDRLSRAGERAYALAKTPRGGALWVLAKNTRPVRQRRA